jgi:hypothetical protein
MVVGSVESALRDPEGCRRALFVYGATYDWRACQLGPIRFEWGAYAWLDVLNRAEALQLGLAWQAAEALGDTPPSTIKATVYTENGPERQTPPEPSKEETKMPVLPWKSTEWNGPEPGYHPARIAEIIDQPAGEKKPGMMFDPKPQLCFRFVVLTQEGQDTIQEMRGWCNAVWAEKSKLMEWSGVILKGRGPKANEAFDTDVLLNRKVDILVDQEEGKNPKITRLYPYRSMSVRDEEEAFPEGHKASA